MYQSIMQGNYQKEELFKKEFLKGLSKPSESEERTSILFL